MDWTDRSGPGQADMDGPNGSAADGRKQQQQKKKKSSIPERVTLKKEIGLLSACTIIIGEEQLQQQLPVTAAAQLSLQLCVASVGNNPKAHERK